MPHYWVYLSPEGVLLSPEGDVLNPEGFVLPHFWDYLPPEGVVFTLLAEPFLTVHMLCTEKRLCTNPVKFLLSMLSPLLSNSFEPRLNRCSFLTVSFRRTFRRHFYLLPAGSVSIIGFSQKLMLALEKPV